MKHQRGLSLNGMMIGSAVLAVFALLGMKAVPPWIEYANVLKAVKATAGDASLKEASVAAVRTAYGKRAEIDNVQSVRPDDLDVTKEGGELVISFAYTSKVPLFKNTSLVFDFEGSSAK